MQDRLLRVLHAHLSANPAVPEAGAGTSGSTILLRVVPGEVTGAELEGGCSSLRAPRMEHCRIKLVLKWPHAISKLHFFSGCSGKDLVQGFWRIQGLTENLLQGFSALRFLGSCFLVQCVSSFPV